MDPADFLVIVGYDFSHSVLKYGASSSWWVGQLHCPPHCFKGFTVRDEEEV